VISVIISGFIIKRNLVRYKEKLLQSLFRVDEKLIKEKHDLNTLVLFLIHQFEISGCMGNDKIKEQKF